MTNSALGDGASKRKVPDRHAGVTREVADLVRHCSNIDGRHGFRVIAKGLSGHIFFERGRVIHAEFGEDCGLRAVVEMLRAGPVQLESATSWPSQPSLHLGPELLLSLTGADASRVVRKVDLPAGPPPLPEPEPAELVPPAHREGSRGGAKRAISGVMPRMVNQSNLEPVDVKPVNVEQRKGASGELSTPSGSMPEPTGNKAAALASRRSAAIAAGRLAVSVAVSERARARAAGQVSPPPPPVRARPTATSSAAVPASPDRGASTALPITRAQTARSRSIVVAPVSTSVASSATESSTAPTGATRRLPEPRRDGAPVSRPPDVARSPAAFDPGQPTTMVRIAVRGDLLAARGKNAEQLAEAAAFIHGVANLIAADFGRHGRANVHLSGGGLSLLVARSEVNDIAAALGPSERLTSLLGKVGFK